LHVSQTSGAKISTSSRDCIFDDVTRSPRDMVSAALAWTVAPVATVRTGHTQRIHRKSKRSSCRAGKRVGSVVEDDDKDEQSNTEGSYSKFSETSSLVKNLVSGLTSVVNFFGAGGNDENTENEESSKDARLSRPYPSTPRRTPEQLANDISKEFTEAKYLWSGDITSEMYDLFTTFTDPTLSFTGLATFERNVRNLQPVLKRLVRDGGEVELFECGVVRLGDGETENIEKDAVRASWRMVGKLNLPWRPKIDLKGRTTFTFRDFGDKRGCLIIEYREEWELTAGQAVSQLVKPFAW
jgi:hypothetical protein